MAKCPSCNADIDSLDFTEVRIYSGGLVLYDMWFTTEDVSVDSNANYYCPKCHNKVASDEDTAKSILKGEYDG